MKTVRQLTAGIIGFSVAALYPSLGASQDIMREVFKDVTRAIIVDQIRKGQQRSSKGSRRGSGSKSSRGGQRSAKANRTAQTQRQLTDLGFSTGGIDGAMGNATRQAISAYQRSRGYAVTGALTREQSAGLAAEHARMKTPNAAGPLRQEIYAAQVYMGSLGYNPGAPDGKWGRRSQGAIDQFRADHGLTGSGRVNLRELAKLAALATGVGGAIYAADSAPGAGNTVAGNMIVAGNSLGGGDFSGSGGPEYAAPFSAPSAVAPPVAPPFNQDSYVHIGGPVAQSQWINKALAMQVLRSEPSLLDDENNAARWFDANVLSDQYGTNPDLARQYVQGNGLAKENIRAQYLATTRGKIRSVIPISADNPLKLALYEPVHLSGSVGEYVEGRGLRLRLEPIYNKNLEMAHLQTRLSMSTDVAGTNFLPVSRQDATRWIDMARHRNHRLVQVFWGRLEKIGEDRNLQSFAAQNSGYFSVPSTFVLERVTLHQVPLVPGGSAKVDPEILFEWPIGAKPAPAASGNGLEFARNLGLTIKNGHVFPGYSAGPQGVGFEVQKSKDRQDPYRQRRIAAQLLALTKLSIDPDWAQKGTTFAGLAYLMFDDAQKRRFFGDKAAVLANRPPNRMIDEHFGNQLFADEFARQRAKRAFFETEFPAIQQQAAKWPMPVVNIAKIGVGEYDFDAQAFPITGYVAGEKRAFRVANLINGSGGAILSADWIGNLPGQLAMPVDQAEKFMQRLRNNRNAGLYLGWTSQLDMTQDGSDIEARSQDGRKPSGPIRPGRATLQTIGIYLDPDLTTPVLMLDPADVSSDIAPVDRSGAEVIEDIVALPLVSKETLTAIAIDANPDETLLEQLIERSQAVQYANEFNIAEAKAAERAAFDAIERDGPLWVEAKVRLGKYDVEKGSFPVENVSDIRIDRNTGMASEIELGFTRPLAGMRIDVPVDQAQSIVVESQRSVLVRIRSEIARSEYVPFNHAVGFRIQLAPQEAVFYRFSRAINAMELVGRVDLAKHSSAVAAAQYKPEDFQGLSAVSLVYDAHMRDLIRLKQGGMALTRDVLDAMMLNAGRNYEQAKPTIGPLFFDRFPTQATKPQRAEVLDSFKSWIMAKSKAMGPRLTLPVSLGAPGDCQLGFPYAGMNDLVRVDGIFGDNPVKADLEHQQAQLRDAPHAHMFVERAYVSSLREIDPTTGYCTVHGGMSAKDVSQDVFVLWGLTRRSSYEQRNRKEAFMQIDILADDIAVLPHGDKTGVRIEAEVVETRFLNRQGVTINTFSGDMPQDDRQVILAMEDEGEEQGDESRAAGQMAAQTAAQPVMPAVTPALAQPSDDATGATVLDDGSVSMGVRSDFDLLGVFAGQSFDEAEAILASQLQAEAKFITTTSADNPQRGPMGFVRSFVFKDATQAFSLFGPTDKGPVVAVARVFKKEQGWPLDRLLDGLEKKYAMAKGLFEDETSVWWTYSDPGIEGACPALPLFAPDERFHEMRPVGTREPKTEWLDIVTRSPAIATASQGDLQNRGECGSFVQLTLPDGEATGDRVSEFSIFLFDPSIAALVRQPAQVKEEIDIEF